MDKGKVTSSFRRILYGLYFLAPFLFSLSLSFGKSLTSARIKGGAAAPTAPRFLRA